MAERTRTCSPLAVVIGVIGFLVIATEQQVVQRLPITLLMSDQMAWVTFDQHRVDTGEPDMDMPGLSHEMRILEKQGGEWKIAYVGWLLKGD